MILALRTPARLDICLRLAIPCGDRRPRACAAAREGGSYVTPSRYCRRALPVTTPLAAQTMPTHRIPAALAMEAAEEAVAACARQNYHETADVVDADGVSIAVLRGDGTRRHSLDSAHAKAYTPPLQVGTLALAERAKGEDGIAPLAKLPHVMFFGGGVPIKLGDEVIGAIGAAGAPGGKLDDGCARAGLEKICDRLK